MDTTFHSYKIPYSQTAKFSKIILDYVGESAELREFYEHAVDEAGIRSAIDHRKKFPTNRKLLYNELVNQYTHIASADKVMANVTALLQENTFTICTAHQPNLFTGHLYFIYKIMHVIRLATDLKEMLPEYHFVPVFFMGSEDADLEELNHIIIDGLTYEWQTKQTGAVGRMLIDEALIKLIDNLAGRLLVEKHGAEIITLLRKCYTKGTTIQDATFLFVHELFQDYGLVVFLSDKATFKNEIKNIITEDIFNNISSKIVQKTSDKLSSSYKAQAHPREINLFYLKDNLRERLVASGDNFAVHDTDIVFTPGEIRKEIDNHPERFSPNVILRGLYQEIILPDVAWIGGGGELAYWLQLKDLFNHYKVPYPVLILRNSFMVIEKKSAELLKKLSLSRTDIFKGETQLLNNLVKTNSTAVLELNKEKEQFQELFADVKEKAKQVDVTLLAHTDAVETRFMKALTSIEKKMFRAEKRKFADQKNQLGRLFKKLFPNNGLQERTENFMLLYARYGEDFFHNLFEYSPGLDQEFSILEEQ